MRRLLALLFVLTFPAVVAAQSSVITSGDSLPATCRPTTTYKPLFYQNGVGLFVCTATNTWTAAVTGTVGNSFFAVTGPTTSTKTFTFPNANATVLTDNAAVTVSQGGTGAAPAADDQVLVSSSTSAAAWKTLTDCAGTNQAVTYTASSNTWGCATISAGAGGGGTTTIEGVILQPQGRLTLTSGTPFLASGVTGATAVYYTPAAGNFVPIYDGSTWNTISFSELSQATTDSTKSPAAAGAYEVDDFFVWDDGGTLRLSRGPSWTQAQTFTVTIASPAVFSATAHGLYECEPIVLSTSGALPTGLSAGTVYFILSAGLTANAFEVATSCGGTAVNTSGTQSGTHTVTQKYTQRGSGAGTTELEFINGILMNKNSITNGPAADRGTYVGSCRTNASSQIDMVFGTSAGAAGGETTVIGCWNMYNRRPIAVSNFDNTNTWNYTTSTHRIKNGNFSNRIQFLVGWQGDGLDAINHAVRTTSAAIDTIVSVGYNATTVPAMPSWTTQSANTAGGTAAGQGGYRVLAPLGFNYVAPLEFSNASGTTTWYGDNGGTQLYSLFTLTTTF